MTISVNTTMGTCPICIEDYDIDERYDTDEVIELACHHFHHRDCIERWLSTNESNLRNLTCAYCTQITMPKSISLDYYSPQVCENYYSEKNLRAHFLKIEQDPYQTSTVVRAVKEMIPHCNHILNLLKGHIPELYIWIEKNISKELESLAANILLDFHMREGTFETLEQQKRNLSYIPREEWSTRIPNRGIAVKDYTSDGKPFRMRVSKDYLEKVTENYIYNREHNIPNFNRIHHLGKFTESLRRIENIYSYDPEVLDCLEDVRSLRKEISDLIQINNSLPMEEILSLIKEMVINSQLIDSRKRVVLLVINGILFDHGALRTLTEEVDRWKKEPIGNWPTEIEQGGPIFLHRGKLTSCNSKDFKQLCGRKDYKEVIAFMLDLCKIHDVEKFEEGLNTIQQRYYYDQEVLDAINDARNFRKDVSDILKKNSNCPMEFGLFYIDLTISRKISDSSKKNLIASIIKEVLFARGAIRTCEQEVNRWKKVPVEEWPLEIKENGISFLSKDDSVKHCEVNDFEKLGASHLTNDKIKPIAYGALALTAIGTGIYYISTR
ncbi:MAG: RING finger domain-containing protein [Chlamydiales bacterium]